MIGALSCHQAENIQFDSTLKMCQWQHPIWKFIWWANPVPLGSYDQCRRHCNQEMWECGNVKTAKGANVNKIRRIYSCILQMSIKLRNAKWKRFSVGSFKRVWRKRSKEKIKLSSKYKATWNNEKNSTAFGRHSWRHKINLCTHYLVISVANWPFCRCKLFNCNTARISSAIEEHLNQKRQNYVYFVTKSRRCGHSSHQID